MAQTAAAALKSARAYLNDTNGVSWSDSILFPLLQEAFGELVQELERHNCATLKFETAPVTIAPGTTSFTVPANLIAPTSMFESDIGALLSGYMEMAKVASLPFRTPEATLHSWCWQGDQIIFLGALAERSVILRYEGTPPVPDKATDSLTIIAAERYIGPRIAALAYSVIQRDNKMLLSLADSALYKIVQSRVVNDQHPVRRRGFREPRVYTLPGSAVIYGSGTGSGGGAVTWQISSTVPNGTSITQFLFGFRPLYVSWNGLNQFEGVGYTVASVGGQFGVTFIDQQSGQVAIPALGDDIHGARQS